MKRRLKKSVEWKSNNRKNFPESKFNTKKKGKLSKKITLTSSNWNRPVTVNWVK